MIKITSATRDRLSRIPDHVITEYSVEKGNNPDIRMKLLPFRYQAYVRKISMFSFGLE